MVHLVKIDFKITKRREWGRNMVFGSMIIRADFRLLESAASLEHQPLSMPVLYLWGERDRTVSLQSALKWGRYFEPPMKLQTIREGSHMFMMHQPSTVAHVLTSFMTPDE